MKTKHTFVSIDAEQLASVSGGAARVAATAKKGELDLQLQLMLTQLGDSIKEVGKSNNNDSLMPMMMMMMMMGGGGGSVAPAAAPAPAPPPPTYVRVNARAG